MSVFSTCFNRIKERRNLNASEIAKLCDFDVTIVYKWAKGIHTPRNWNTLEIMCEKLHLSATEKKELQCAYERTILGEEKYASYQKIIEILECLQNRGREYNSQGMAIEIVENIHLKPLPEFVEYNNELEIMNCIQNVLTYLTMKNEREMFLKIQPLHQNVVMLIRMFCNRVDNCSLEEIVIFSDECYGSVLYNLDIIKGLLNLLIQKHPIQIYGREEYGQEGKILDNWIITDDFVVEFADDFSYGMITTHPAWVAHFKKQYEKIKRSSRILGKKECKIPEDFLINPNESLELIEAIEYMPCIGACLTKEILEQHIFEELSEREKLMDSILLYGHAANSGMVKTRSFFFREGLIEFMETGNIEVFPYEVYYPIKYKACCDIIQNGINYSKKGLMDYQMIRDGQLSSLKGIYVEQTKGNEKHLVIDFHFDEGKKERFRIYSEEIRKEFEGFFEFLSDSAYVYSVEETAKQMQEIVDEYRRKV